MIILFIRILLIYLIMHASLKQMFINYCSKLSLKILNFFSMDMHKVNKRIWSQFHQPLLLRLFILHFIHSYSLSHSFSFQCTYRHCLLSIWDQSAWSFESHRLGVIGFVAPGACKKQKEVHCFSVYIIIFAKKLTPRKPAWR